MIDIRGALKVFSYRDDILSCAENQERPIAVVDMAVLYQAHCTGLSLVKHLTVSARNEVEMGINCKGEEDQLEQMWDLRAYDITGKHIGMTLGMKALK